MKLLMTKTICRLLMQTDILKWMNLSYICFDFLIQHNRISIRPAECLIVYNKQIKYTYESDLNIFLFGF
ncbi:unnamed protein product [Rotaria socialis]